jgi:hypothetical protein
MALSDRDIIITPNRGAASEPNILFRGGDALNSGTITLTVLNTGSTAILRWSGSAGNLVSITNTSGTALNVLSTTQATNTLTGALQVAGGVGIQGNLWVGGTINGTIAGAGSATTATNLAGGAANRIPFQTAPNTTGFIVAPSVAGTVLTWNGSAFTYTTPAGTFNGGTITSPLFINNATPTSSTSTGAFVVLGGVGIGGGLVVGNITTVTNTTNASSTATGAFQVRGGAAVGLDLRVGGLATIGSTLAVTGNTTLTGDLAVNGGDITSSAATFNLLNSGVTTLNLAGASTAITVGATTGYTRIRNLTTVTNATNASSTTTGALVVTGGAGIGGNLHVGGALIVNGTPVTPIASLFNEQTATAGQTTFTIPGGYTAPFIQVFANGILLSTANYTASNGTTVVVNNARNAGDIMRFIAGSNVLGFTTATFASNIFGGAANQLLVQTGLNATGFVTAPVTANTVLTWNGSALTWVTPSAAATTMLTAGSPTNAVFFPAFVDSNNATAAAESLFTTSSFTINPSTRAVGVGGTFNSVGAANLGTGVTGDIMLAGSASSRMIVNTGGAGVRIRSEGANPLSLYASTLGIGGLTINNAGGIVTINSNTNATSVATGALRVVGGVGIQGNLWVGGTINGTIVGSVTGSATTATNIAGGTAGQVPYQTGVGATSFFGPGTSGNVLVSNGTGAPTYNNVLVLAGTTAATSTNTGALQVRGGVGIGGGLVVGNITTVTNTTNATNTATGAFQVLGGAAIGLDLRVGGTIFQNGVPVGTGAASSAAGVTTVSSATNAARFITFVDNNHGSATTSSVYTDAGITYNPSTNALRTAGTGTFAVAVNTAFTPTLYLQNNAGGNIGYGTAMLMSARTQFKAGIAFEDTAGFGVGTLHLLNNITANEADATKADARLSIVSTGQVIIPTAISATSTSTGALVVRGGIGANGNIYTSGNLFLENINANITLGSSTLGAGLKTVTLNRTTTGDSAIIRAGNQSYFGGNTNLDILNNSSFTNFDLRSFSSAGWGPTGQGVRIRIEGSQGDVQIFNNTEATSTSTGALQVRGGLAVGGNIHFGGNLYQNGVLFTAGGGGEPIVFNDISANFDGLESVFTLKDGFNSTGTVDVFSAGLDWTAVTLPLNGGGGAPPPSTTLLGTTVGNGSIVVPANVSTMVLEAWGGGGGSAGLNRTGTDTAAGGAFATSVVNVTSGQTVFFSIGAGGTGGSTVGGAGTQSWINVGSNSVPVSNTTGVRAAGGAGSGVAFPNNSTQLANSVGTVINIGGAGPAQIDDGGGGTAPPAPLYAFTNATFTPGTQTEQFGPALSTARTGLTGTGVDTWKNNTEYFNTTNGVQIWTVAESAVYTITAAGARGGGNGGGGAIVRGTFALTVGEKLYIIVGQTGNSSSCGGGGGGGTFVARVGSEFGGNFVSWAGVSMYPLLVGGGGGGQRDTGSDGPQNGSMGTYGTFEIGTVCSNGGAGGPINGSSPGAGGWLTNGGTGNSGVQNASDTGRSFVNGGQGGNNNRSPGKFGGGSGATCEICNTAANAGNGGGYSGGGARTSVSACYVGGGGGGSFIHSLTTTQPATSNGSWGALGNSSPHSVYSGAVSNFGSFNTAGAGYVIITKA